MKPRVYLETSIISYLTAWPSRDPIRAADQLVTREWWENRRGDYDLFVSDVVLNEIKAGDPVAASERLAAIEGIVSLDITASIAALASGLIDGGPLPKKAGADALHIAISAAEGMDVLLTWNCVHIANPSLQQRIHEIIRASTLMPPRICTPRELWESAR